MSKVSLILSWDVFVFSCRDCKVKGQFVKFINALLSIVKESIRGRGIRPSESMIRGRLQ
jgi:hypothetical protein